MDLTKDGLQQWREAAGLLFAHVALLRSKLTVDPSGARPQWPGHLLEELARLSRADFDFAERGEPSDTLVTLLPPRTFPDLVNSSPP